MCVCDWNGLLDQRVENAHQSIPTNLVLSTANHEDPLLLHCIPVLHGRDAVKANKMEVITKLLLHKSFDRREVVLFSFANVQNVLHDEHHRLHVLDRLDHLPADLSMFISKA